MPLQCLDAFTLPRLTSILNHPLKCHFNAWKLSPYPAPPRRPQVRDSHAMQDSMEALEEAKRELVRGGGNQLRGGVGTAAGESSDLGGGPIFGVLLHMSLP